MGDVATSSVLAGPRGVDQSKPSVFQVYSELEFVLYNPRRFERVMLMSSAFSSERPDREHGEEFPCVEDETTALRCSAVALLLCLISGGDDRRPSLVYQCLASSGNPPESAKPGL